MELASPFVPHGFPASPFVGARCPPPFIRSSLSPAAINGSPSPQCRQVCGTAMLLFLPQALLPAGKSILASPSKKALLNC